MKRYPPKSIAKIAHTTQPIACDEVGGAPFTQILEVADKAGPSGLTYIIIRCQPCSISGLHNTGDAYSQILVKYVRNFPVSLKYTFIVANINDKPKLVNTSDKIIKGTKSKFHVIKGILASGNINFPKKITTK